MTARDGGDELPASDALSRSELKRRASAGIFIVGSFGLINLVVGFGGNVVLARLLVPSDFGIVALGATLTVFARTLCDGGLGAGLIRREHPPSRRELRAVLGLQLCITTALAALGAGVAATFGRPGLIVAIMMMAIPITAFELPGRLMLTRALLYRRIATADACAVVVFYGWAIGGVLAGFGVWALATAAIARALAGAVVMLSVSEGAIVRPSLRGARELVDVIRFGIRFQGVSIAVVVRDQILVVATGAVAGVATLGLWSFARRLLEVPLLVFQGLWRVSFPAMAQLLAARENPAPLIERGVALSTVAAGLVLSTFAAASPELVPAVFGEQWRDAAAAIPPACLALLVVGPVSVATVGYLHAAGDPMAVLRAQVSSAVVWLCVGLPLLPLIGVAALGLGWFAGSLADLLVLTRATRRHSGARVLQPLAVPLAIGIAAGAAGFAVAVAGPDTFLSAVAGACAATAVQLGGLALFRRALLRETAAAVLGSVRTALVPARSLAPEPT